MRASPAFSHEPYLLSSDTTLDPLSFELTDVFARGTSFCGNEAAMLAYGPARAWSIREAQLFVQDDTTLHGLWSRMMQG